MRGKQQQVEAEVIDVNARSIGSAKNAEVGGRVTKRNFGVRRLIKVIYWVAMLGVIYFVFPNSWPFLMVVFVIPNLQFVVYGCLVYTIMPGDGPAGIFAAIAVVVFYALFFGPSSPTTSHQNSTESSDRYAGYTYTPMEETKRPYDHGGSA